MPNIDFNAIQAQDDIHEDISTDEEDPGIYALHEPLTIRGVGNVTL